MSNFFDHKFTLKSCGLESIIHFKLVEIEINRYPSLSFQVQVKDQSFSGEITTWIEQETLLQFLLQLKAININRKGAASLQSMNPEDLLITIECDKLNRFAVNYATKHFTYSSNSLVETSLRGSFILDSEYLLSVEDDVSTIVELIIHR